MRHAIDWRPFRFLLFRHFCFHFDRPDGMRVEVLLSFCFAGLPHMSGIRVEANHFDLRRDGSHCKALDTPCTVTDFDGA